MTEEAQYIPNHRVTDVRLAVYLILNIVGFATAAYGYFVKPFSASKLLVGIGSSLYLLLSSIWMAVSYLKITPTVFRGSAGKGSKKALWIDTECLLPSAVYKIMVRDSSTGRALEPTFEAPVSEFVDAKGKLNGVKFCRHMESFLTTKVPQLLRQD